jgi:hypothetical protein
VFDIHIPFFQPGTWLFAFCLLLVFVSWHVLACSCNLVCFCFCFCFCFSVSLFSGLLGNAALRLSKTRGTQALQAWPGRPGRGG